MSKRAAFWIFLLGTLSSAILFLYLTYDTHKQVDILTHADKLTDDVVAGKRVWEKRNCNDCHTILGFGGYYAPDMTKAYKRLGAEGIRKTVEHPDQVFASSWRKMPVQNLTGAETQNLIAFLKWVSEIDNHDWPPQDSESRISRSALKLAGGVGMDLGIALFKEKGCIGCHRISGVGGTSGPALDHVASVPGHDASTLKKFIRDPKSVHSDSTMPPQEDLSEAELDAITNYLVNLK